MIYYVTMATLLLNRGKNDIKNFYFHHFFMATKLTPPPNLSLISLKIKKLNLDPKTKNGVITTNQ